MKEKSPYVLFFNAVLAVRDSLLVYPGGHSSDADSSYFLDEDEKMVPILISLLDTAV